MRFGLGDFSKRDSHHQPTTTTTTKYEQHSRLFLFFLFCLIILIYLTSSAMVVFNFDSRLHRQTMIKISKLKKKFKNNNKNST